MNASDAKKLRGLAARLEVDRASIYFVSAPESDKAAATQLHCFK